MMNFDILVFFFCQNLSLVSDKYFIHKYIYVKEQQLNRLTLCVLYEAEDVDRKTKLKHCKQSCLNKFKKQKKNMKQNLMESN